MPKKKTSNPASTPIASVRHKDMRKNIPTEELRDFVAADVRHRPGFSDAHRKTSGGGTQWRPARRLLP